MERAIGRLVRAIREGAVEPKVIGPELNAAAGRKEEIEAKLRAMPRDDAAVLHPQAAERYRRQVAQLRVAMKAGRERAGREVVDLVRA